MIVKDEAAVLARCLDSAKDVADEIIIVDTGSTDETKAVAQRYTDKVFDFEWINDFSAARNFSYAKATMDYQLWLDADDILPEKSQKELLALKESLDPSYEIVAMKYHTHFDGDGNPILISTRERLTKREKNYQWIDPVHECIPLVGKSFYSDIEIHHKKPEGRSNPDRNLNIYTAREAAGKEFSPRQQYYFARELKDHGLWEKSAMYFERFLDGGEGWIEDNIAACYNLSICYNAMKQPEKVLPILTKSFLYDAPRAETCSEIGYYYKRGGFFTPALKWFKIAANLGSPDSAGFILMDYWGYIPCVECCVCFCELGDFENAKIYNERAGVFRPDSPAVKHNREYLATK
jgi:glycosyltransferase involved in cell wall biosynthesis